MTALAFLLGVLVAAVLLLTAALVATSRRAGAEADRLEQAALDARRLREWRDEMLPLDS
ncbi:hypothetical protein [Rubrivirga sp. SAORIC476]|uniref:hypothetical protein n=1 Tax=Rubrivirga sp. SAORIC476 TaxID=1961794 RepID=UPI00130474B6|nr:hypothetical protein [Rubrivirga sp. SAORIC476]